MCKSGSGAGKCAGAKSNTVRRRSNHARTEDQAGREKRANTDAAGGWRVHTAVDTPRRNAATRSQHLSFMCQGDIHTAQGSCRVEQERDNTSRGRNNGDTTGRKRRQQHRLRVVRPRAHPEEVTPEKGKCNRAVQARDTLAFKQQMFNVAPSVFPSRLSPRSRTKVRTCAQREDVIVAETAQTCRYPTPPTY